MIVCRDTRELGPPPAAGSVVSIGVFDGVHLGHEAILRANLERSAELGARPTVVTFSTHPKQVLLGRAPRTLTSLAHRLSLFERAGIEHVLALEFDEVLRSTPAETFAREVLVDGLAVRSLVLGFDSKFGRDRKGTPELLMDLGFDVRVVPKVVVGDRAVSSTAIREAVELGDLEGAARMLGRPVTLYGEVVHGEEVGRTLGFPTANLDLHHELHPPPGVYACRVHVASPDAPTRRRFSRPAACNIGFRPTLDGKRPEHPWVEVHLLDWEGDLFAGLPRWRPDEPALLRLADELGLDAPLLERRPSALSGGQLQRVAIARALAAEPRLLIADEISSALDRPIARDLVRLLAARVERGLGLLVITHDLALWPAICGEVVVLSAGRVVERGPPARVLGEPAHPLTRELCAAIFTLP